MQRASHALAVEGRVWLVDPVDAPELEARIRLLGEPAGVVQLLDRHGRDCAAWAARLGVPMCAASTMRRRRRSSCSLLCGAHDGARSRSGGERSSRLSRPTR